jgi:hypothetical protein
MRDECLDGLLALAEQQGQLTRLPQIIESRPAVAVSCLVLLIPLAVCPVCGREQPNAGTARRSEMGHKRTRCPALDLLLKRCLALNSFIPPARRPSSAHREYRRAHAETAG